jgi:hypothetical protein
MRRSKDARAAEEKAAGSPEFTARTRSSIIASPTFSSVIVSDFFTNAPCSRLFLRCLSLEAGQVLLEVLPLLLLVELA